LTANLRPAEALSRRTFRQHFPSRSLVRPRSLSTVAELKLLWLRVVIVLVPLPKRTLKAFGEAVSLKFHNGLTLIVICAVALRLPDVPSIVTVTDPVAAVALAVKVSVLLLVAGLGLNAAVTPLGQPAAERVTLPLKPFAGVMLIVLVPWLPSTMLTLAGDAESVKFGVPFTLRLNVVVRVRLPDVPVIVTVAVPVAAVALAVKVSVLLLVAGLGLNAAVTPLGKPPAESVTLPVKPFTGVRVIVLLR
jgi:hypothetical protein